MIEIIRQTFETNLTLMLIWGLVFFIIFFGTMDFVLDVLLPWIRERRQRQ